MKVWNVRDPKIPTDTVVVRAEDLLQLEEDRAELRALEAAGVDNWQGCDEIDWEKINSRVASLRRRLDVILGGQG
jgi:hypothetical protein